MSWAQLELDPMRYPLDEPRGLDRDDLLVNLGFWRYLPSMRTFVHCLAQHRTLRQDR